MNTKNMWNTAGIAGLALGGASTAYMFLSQWVTVSGMPGFVASILNFILWTAKFGGCIWLMMYFMKRFASENTDADNSDTFKFGTISALLSALIFSAASFANVAFISADMFAEQFDATLQQLAPMMDSNSLASMDKIIESLPQITFFSNLIYCFIFGTVLSAILSRNIPSKDPFADYKPDEQ